MTTESGSPIDAEASQAPSPTAPRASRARRQEIPPGHEQVTTTTRTRPVKDGNGSVTSPSPSSAEAKPSGSSPLDTDAAIDISMVEVERVGPGSGPGWQGRRWMGQEVYYGRMGRLPKNDRIYDAATEKWGGGEYEFRTSGTDGKALAPVRKRWGGPPLEPDNIDLGGTMNLPFSGTGQLPMGWGTPGLPPPGFQPGFGPGFGPLEPGEPDALGFVAPQEQQAQSEGVTGWVFLHGVQRWKWMGPGLQPSGPPPPLPGTTTPAMQQQFAPWLYDHSRRPEEEDGGRLARLERLVEKLAERPAADPIAGYAAMMKAQNDADRLRWEKEAEEARRRWDVERDERKSGARASEEAAKVQAEAQKEIARLNAETLKETAKLQADAARDQQKMMMELLAKSADPIAPLKRIADVVGMPLFGGGERSEGAELAKVVNEAVTSGTKGIAEILSVWKGGQAAQATSAAQGISSEDQARWDYFRLLGLIIREMEMGIPAEEVPKHIAVACMTLGLDLDQTATLLRLATPDMIAAKIEEHVQGKQVSPDLRKQVDGTKAAFLSERGRAYIEGIRMAMTPPSALPGSKK